MTCCFIGHRKIEDVPEVRERLQRVLLQLIRSGTVNFIFGDHSAFDDLCYNLVTELKEKHPAIRRIHFRTDYGDANEYTMQFLLSGYEESLCPPGIENAGRASYIERNRAMIRESDICVFYYDENYFTARRKSGTADAYRYAVQKEKRVYNLCVTASAGRP